MSGTDRVLFGSNERVDLEDLDFAVNGGLSLALEKVAGQFLTDPAGARAWILDGFVTTNPSGTQIRVGLGRAILSRRDGGEVFHGVVTSEGAAEKILDVATFTTGVAYGVYVHFEFLDGDQEGRAFWDSGASQEFVQTVATRRSADWSMRIESASPGADWLLVATFTLAVGPTVTVLADVRPLYFEGAVNTAYASGWSSDGGGASTDRNSDRQAYGVTDLQSFTAAARQCLEDLKGRGLRRWWDRDIGGMNIGFDAAPVEDRLAVWDADFWMGVQGGLPVVAFDTISDRIEFDRGAGHLNFYLGSALRLFMDPLYTRFSQDVNITTGLAVGFAVDSTGIASDQLYVGDDRFRLDGSAPTAPKLWFDDSGGDDYLTYTRSVNLFEFYIGGANVASVRPTGITVVDGINVGFGGVPVTDVAAVGDAAFRMNFNAGVPQLEWASGDYLAYNRTSNNLTVEIGGESVLDLTIARTGWHKLLARAPGATDTLTNPGSTPVPFATVGTVPANFLRQYATGRIRAVVDMSSLGTPTYVGVGIWFGGIRVAYFSAAAPTTSYRVILEASITIEDHTSSGPFRWGSIAIANKPNGSGLYQTVYVDSDNTVSMLSPVSVEIRGDNPGGGASDTLRLQELTIEWAP